MSVDLLSLGRHNLDVSSIEKTAQQLSDRFDINIEIGEWDDGNYLSHTKIERHPGEPFYRMNDSSESYLPVQFYLDAPEQYIKTRSGLFCFLVVSLESVSICLWEESWRWQWYWNLFGDDEEYRAVYGTCLEDIRRFRKAAKKLYHILGADYIYCYADQGPSDCIGDYEDGTWEEFENAIRTGKYLDCDYVRREYPDFTANDLRIINVSDYLLGINTEPSHSWWDIFYDDFADI